MGFMTVLLSVMAFFATASHPPHKVPATKVPVRVLGCGGLDRTDFAGLEPTSGTPCH